LGGDRRRCSPVGAQGTGVRVIDGHVVEFGPEIPCAFQDGIVLSGAAVENAEQAGVPTHGAAAVGGEAASNPVTESVRREALP
jgi:hypothetical protein